MNPRKVRLLCQHLREEVHGQLDYFATLWPGYDEEDNPESPHRQRTAVNRLMGYALFLGMQTGRRDPEAEHLNTLRAWQKKVGPLRDLDVIRQWIGKCLGATGPDATPAAEAFHVALTEERARLLKEIRLDAKGLPGARTRAVVPSLLASFEEALQAIELRPALLDETRALRQVATPWGNRLALLHSSQSDVLIHSFRVTNKRLRFVLELLSRTEGRRTPWGRALFSAARTAAEAHTTLGNLSDLLMVNERLRLLRAKWSIEGRHLDTEAGLLERGRLALEAKELDRWFSQWPALAAEGFVPFPQRKENEKVPRIS